MLTTYRSHKTTMRPVRTLLEKEDTGLLAQNVDEPQLVAEIAQLERFAQIHVVTEQVTAFRGTSGSVCPLGVFAPCFKCFQVVDEELTVMIHSVPHHRLADEESDLEETLRCDIQLQVVHEERR